MKTIFQWDHKVDPIGWYIRDHNDNKLISTSGFYLHCIFKSILLRKVFIIYSVLLVYVHFLSNYTRLHLIHFSVSLNAYLDLPILSPMLRTMSFAYCSQPSLTIVSIDSHTNALYSIVCSTHESTVILRETFTGSCYICSTHIYFFSMYTNSKKRRG
jgi:hypothetical protein